jgi:HEAT repeat protein
MSKRPSKAAQAAMKATGVERPPRRKPTDVLARLREIDESFSRGPENRFDAEIKAGPAAVQKLVEKLADRDAEIRADAAEALGRVGDTKALTPLRALLKDADGEVRTNAAVALIRVGDEKLFPEVVKALRHDDPRVVIGAAVALGRLADKRVVPNLVEAFKTDHVEVGAAVAWALGQCGDAAALPWLITALEQGFATANVCEALGRIGDPKAQPSLIKALDYASDDTRAYAARALGLVKHAGATRGGALAENRAIPPLKTALNDRSRKVRLCAAIALYELGEKLGAESVVDELTAT